MNARKHWKRLIIASAALSTLAPNPAAAQPAPQPADELPSAAPPEPPSPEDAVGAPTGVVDPLAAALAPQPGGLTPAKVARRAKSANPVLRVKRADLEAARARVDQALVAYFPTATVTASYTRVSEVDNVSLLAPCPDAPNLACQVRPSELGNARPYLPAPTRSPLFLNHYALIAGLTVPISDYGLRIPQEHESAKLAARAASEDEQATGRDAVADALLVFYAWIASRGQLVVAELAVEQARAHRQEASELVPLGLASRADSLRLEAQLAAAEQLRVDAEAVVEIAAEELRIALEAESTEQLRVGFDVFRRPGAARERDAEALVKQALERRPELSALDDRAEALEYEERGAWSGYFPRVEGFANGYYQNPNPREYIQRAEWRFTWDAGVRLSWTVNETFHTLGSVSEAGAKARSARALRKVLENTIRLEVRRALADMKRARASMDAADRGLVAADEQLRARRLLFHAGEARAVDLVDAETELTRARLNRLRAYVDYHRARTRLARAVGSAIT